MIITHNVLDLIVKGTPNSDPMFSNLHRHYSLLYFIHRNHNQRIDLLYCLFPEQYQLVLSYFITAEIHYNVK